MSTKVILITVATLIVAQIGSASCGRLRRDEESTGDNSGQSTNAVAGSDSFMSNIGQIFGTMPTNPTEFMSAFSNLFKNVPQQLNVS
ncbi:unnamed protein product [Colias eurytheme]|nr:unnamed protein product [Colias eurytheme]